MNQKANLNAKPVVIGTRKIYYTELLKNGISQSCSLLEIQTLGANEQEIKQIMELMWGQMKSST
ncbi:hypothetical protein B1156_14850 [Enterococcus faecium]|uniref:hypothetical protein n=1 Tax=Enterococcus faecium TaxID=1352 RepID=UPI000DEAB66E|nr:hypothetical protein [Enterococcus faecium]RCF55711.1 hypothetical protein B1156_14850 [Enterococcus faecium]